MNQLFDVSTTSRNMVSKFLSGYNLDQLNTIPEGFSNNLIWNIGHIVVVQQMLVYKLSGLPMMISDEMVEKYKRGTKPEQDATQADVDEIQSFLFETINQTKADLEKKVFKDFQEFTTMTGFTIKTAEDAMAFNVYHEALHAGMMMSIRKFI
ncbi:MULTISPECIES: DinB family protein [unclassified Flavobacterium]|uniref:DinB family protein n=1 Tax=unclassified Flavobacterium TaxID=196869 RepID=UPI000C62DAC4|nr:MULTISPECIES: DinB family protein [unclassified Flavobacterium]PIF61472.1 DinB family protein [Flavobacterium sp. 11]WKL42581.1 DinB family protein [Flavobacterium sp. ZE23DGlu08]